MHFCVYNSSLFKTFKPDIWWQFINHHVYRPDTKTGRPKDNLKFFQSYQNDVKIDRHKYTLGINKNNADDQSNL